MARQKNNRWKEDLKSCLVKKKKKKKKEDWLSNKEIQSNSFLTLVALVPQDYLITDFKCVYF